MFMKDISYITESDSEVTAATEVVQLPHHGRQLRQLQVGDVLLRGGTGGQRREVLHGSQQAGEEEAEPVVAVGELDLGQRGVAGVDMIAGWKDCCTGDMNSCGCGAEGEKPGGSLACSGGLG